MWENRYGHFDTSIYNLDTVEGRELAGRSRFEVMFPDTQILWDKNLNTRHDGITSKAVIELKNLIDGGYTRAYSKYNKEDDEDNGYQIDFDKLAYVKCYAYGLGLAPLVAVLFTDRCLIWDLRRSEWEKTGKWVPCNNRGVAYGESKREKFEAYLYKKDAIKEIVYDR